MPETTVVEEVKPVLPITEALPQSPEGSGSATVPPTGSEGSGTPEEKPAEGAAAETEPEPDLEAVPESSGDFSKYKPLFKDYPELRAILGREQAFTEAAPSFSEFREIMQRIPTVADAETLVQDAEAKRTLSATFREDLPAFVESLRESDGLAYAQFAKKFPEILAESDQGLWSEQAAHYTGRVLNNAYVIARNTGDNELLAATELVARGLGIPIGVSTPQPQTNTELEKLKRQLAERDKADQDGALATFWQETDAAITGACLEEIDKTLKTALPAATEQQLGRMRREVWDKTLEAVGAQPQTAAQIGKFRSDAEKGRMGIAEHKAIVDFGTKRARLIIPRVAKEVISEWSNEILRVNKELTEKKKGIAGSTKDVGSGPQGTTSAAAASPPAKGQPRGVGTILQELSTGNYVKR